MVLSFFDLTVFFVFIFAVVAVGILKSREEKTSESYFLAGRGLSWWLIGFSLIAANISTEQFVGMSGQAADYIGLAIASYEWMAAITLVVVAFFFLPTFLRSGIYTIPEFLEYRYNHLCRTIMSVFMMVIYVGVTIAAVIYSGALTVDVIFDGEKILGVLPVNLYSASWIIGLLAAVYVVFGGLKACAWADLLQGSALIIGGAVVVILAMSELGSADPESINLGQGLTQAEAQEARDQLSDAGAIERFRLLNSGKLHMVLPISDKNIPWTALIIGLWIPNFYYWGLNQYITQRTLGAKSLSEGQKGIVFAAALKLVIPFIIVVPGIVAFNLYAGKLQTEATSDNAAVLARFVLTQDKAEDPKAMLAALIEADPRIAKEIQDELTEKQREELLKTFGDVKKELAKEQTPGAVAFRFEKEFAELYPLLTAQVVAFNIDVAGIAMPDDKDVADKVPEEAQPEDYVFAKNEILLKKIEGTPGQSDAIQTELVGYKYDSAFAALITELIPSGLRGFMLAAILGAVMSSLASMLNAASTIFTMDLYKQYFNKGASQANLVAVGRASVVVFVAIGCLIAPLLGHPKLGGIFKYIQEFQGFISPGILAVFVFGLLVRRAPAICGILGLLLNPAIYGLLKLGFPDLAFLDRMAVSFFCLIALMGIITLIRPLKEPVVLPTQTSIDLTSSNTAKVCGVAVVIVTLVLYAIFW